MVQNWDAMIWCYDLPKAKTKKAKKKPNDFWARIGFTPDTKQRALLEATPHRVILNCTRQWGKSTVTAAMAVRRASEAPESLSLVLSPSSRQSGEFMRKAKSFVHRLGEKARGDGTNENSLLLKNGSRIVGLPGREETIRGFSSVGLMLIDEAARVPDELYKSVRPMLAVTNGDLWLMSTPWGKRGFFYEAWANGGEEWTRVLAPATECERISPEFLNGERLSMGERWFRQEYLCEFSDTEDSVFLTDDIQAAIDYDIPALPIPPFRGGQQ